MSYPPYAASGAESFADSEVEVLQTDVMRFMALLGFILMAIFALVQALPVAPARNQPRIEDAALLNEDIRVLEQQLAEQTADLVRLQSAITAAQDEQQRLLAENLELEKRLAELQQDAGEVETQLAESDRKLVATSAALDAGRQTLSDIRRRVERERHALQLTEIRAARIAVLTQAEIEAQRSLSAELKAKPEPEPEPLATPPAVAMLPPKPPDEIQPKPPKTIAERLAEIRKMLPAAPTKFPAATETEAAPPEKSTAVAPQKRGFTLRFASTAAFDRLLAAHTIRFYALIERRAWQFEHQNNGTITTTVVEAPRTYYEMAPATVPAAYRTALRRIVASPASGTVTWSVILPPEIVAKINLAARQLSGADIIINDNGSVFFENEAR